MAGFRSIFILYGGYFLSCDLKTSGMHAITGQAQIDLQLGPTAIFAGDQMGPSHKF